MYILLLQYFYYFFIIIICLRQRYLSEFHKCHLQDPITYSLHGIWVDKLWKKG